MRDDVAMATAEVREMNPGLTEEEVAAAVAQPQAALDAAVAEQEVRYPVSSSLTACRDDVSDQ